MEGSSNDNYKYRLGDASTRNRGCSQGACPFVPDEDDWNIDLMRAIGQ